MSILVENESWLFAEWCEHRYSGYKRTQSVSAKARHVRLLYSYVLHITVYLRTIHFNKVRVERDWEVERVQQGLDDFIKFGDALKIIL